MIRRFFIILAGLILIPTYSAAAGGERFRAVIKGDLDGIQALIPAGPKATAARYSALKPYRFTLKAGPEKFALTFDRVKPKNWAAYFDDGFQVREDNTKVVLLLGSAVRNGTRYKAGATLLRRGKRTRMEVYFKGEGKRSKGRMLRAAVSINKRSVAEGRYAALPAHSFKLCGADGIPTAPFVQAAALSGNVYRFDVATDADFEFFQTHGASSNSDVATYFNILDGIYNPYLHLESEIVEQYTFTSSVEPYTTTVPKDLLNEFQNYRNDTSPYSVPPDLSHLFTGKDLVGDTAGIAKVGAVCYAPQFAYGLSQDFGEGKTPSIAMHEIGHNFGASHSVEGIMQAALGDPPPTFFSSASQQEISAHLAAYGELCLTDTGVPPQPIPDAPDTPTPPTTPSGEMLFDVSFSKSGLFTANIELDEVPSGCEAVLWVAKSKGSLAKAVEVGRVTISAEITEFTAQLNERVKKSNARVQVYAELSCDGESMGLSDVESLRVGRGKSLSRVGKVQWISSLDSML